MKVTNTASAIRVTLSPSEASDLDWLLGSAKNAGVYVPDRAADIIAKISGAADSVRTLQYAKKAEKDRIKREERDRRARERHFMIGNYSVIAKLSDYADISSNPDYRHWFELILSVALGKPIPVQCEIRRNVWHTRVVRLNEGAMSDIVGSDCTDTDADADIADLAHQIIARWENRSSI